MCEKARKLTDEEKSISNADPTCQIDKTDTYALGACMSLVDQIQSGSIENGAIFISANGVELALTNLAMQKHGLRRILIIDWDVNHNLKIQNGFYDSSK